MPAQILTKLVVVVGGGGGGVSGWLVVGWSVGCHGADVYHIPADRSPGVIRLAGQSQDGRAGERSRFCPRFFRMYLSTICPQYRYNRRVPTQTTITELEPHPRVIEPGRPPHSPLVSAATGAVAWMCPVGSSGDRQNYPLRHLASVTAPPGLLHDPAAVTTSRWAAAVSVRVQGGVFFTIALFRLTRCSALIRTFITPALHPLLLVSPPRPITPPAPLLYRMPRRNKSRNTPAADSSIQVQTEAVPEPRDEEVTPEEEEDQNVGDSEIVKSPSDPKQYRYIVLENGLRALLISDYSGPATEQEEEEEEGEEEEEEEEEDEEDDEEDEEDDDEDEDGSDEEDEEEEGKRKKGNAEKQSAAALCVGVGSFSDPPDLPGLAHFLEHMVFMGSEKYPSENGFDAFLKKHGGSDNASTDCERTVFQFDVQRRSFKEALDRWAQFFICPLMIRDAIDREVEAVDSEYQLAKPSDSHRKEMLFGSLAKVDHPMGKFCWGNAQTLKHEPKKQKINVYKRLREFWEQHYSAHYMTLAVQSKEKLDTLEEWVREIFCKVPNNGLSKPDFSNMLDPFDTPAFNKLYRVVPVRKVHALNITWALPPQEKYYRVKPLHYISWLIGHEGTGSILSVLRKKCWALALFGGNSETGFDQNTTYSIFSISIILTDEGFQNFYQVTQLVFQYLKMLQTLGPQQRHCHAITAHYTRTRAYTKIYEEIQKIEANEFHYQEQVINGALSLLTPDRANMMLLSPEHEGRCPLREKWFGTQYSVEDIAPEWMEKWTGELELDSSLHLPAENEFIATDFNLKPSDCPDTELPVRIADSDKGCLWYKKDNKFKIPKAYIRFHLISPVIQKSATK
ncbi:hypothetical protein NL108_010675 [Boleophthalmus pectinirostris]|nr:hypothetical protein NL108_010675 [Boleophthalmus pectinirostris]